MIFGEMQVTKIGRELTVKKGFAIIFLDVIIL